jgi:hypothetical protein
MSILRAAVGAVMVVAAVVLAVAADDLNRTWLERTWQAS